MTTFDAILNPTLPQAAAILAVLAVGIFAGVKTWWIDSAKRRELIAAGEAADKQARLRQIRAELRGGR